jgi:predicted AAA+ superfamily ATPase
MYKRILQKILPLDISCFLLGPRQCGKTTILKELASTAYINLLNSKVFIKYNRMPSILHDEVTALPNKQGVVIVDEIQKIPVLLDEVQRCMDDFPDLRFILSGSSARKLRRGSANLLGGRAANLSIFPLTSSELAEDFDLEHVIKFGSLPKISSLIAQKKVAAANSLLRSYVSTYLTEEIKAESLVRNLDYFQRFLEVAAHQFAKETNVSEIAEQAQISYSSAVNYFGILEDTLLGYFLHPYATSIRKQLTKTPKFYFFDNGVTRAIRGLVSTDVTNQEEGLLFEQFMVQEVLRVNSYHNKDFKINFWRTTGGAEVDLVISRENQILLAIEFKASPFPRSRDLSGLLSFKEEYPKTPVILCAQVERARMIDDKVKVIPPIEVLKIVEEL